MMSGENSVYDLWNNGVLIANDPRKDGRSLAQPNHQVLA